ncbi:lamina-associated polypeptide 2-like [Thamnophis elegans]|uniref:lamina-associated polypeptide 2-like n=1 Tax=Thamnophis elegans TaxID=35005 RepID=UPI001378BEFD|nr:lamina-associated polypeptide 2-like [Thamnophis elegans]
MISEAISRGVGAELARRSQVSRPTLAYSGLAPQAVQGDSSILQTDPPSPLHSVFSAQSPLVEEGEIQDRELSGDEGFPVDQPPAPGLFRHTLFKSLLYKAKTTAHMGEAISAESAAVGLDATERLFAEQVALQDFIPSPKLFLDLIQKQWDEPTAVKPPGSGDRKLFTSSPELETLLQFPTVDAPIAALASPALIPSEISEGLKAEDRKAESVIRKTHQAAAWALRSATAASFFNRTSLVWLRQLQERLDPEELRLHQDVTKLIAALEFSADATLSAAKFASRAVVSNVASRRLLWLRHWQADIKSKWRLASTPFKGGALFGSVLDPILIETRDKRKVLPSTSARVTRRPQPYSRRQPFRSGDSGFTSAPYVPSYTRGFSQAQDRGQDRAGARDRGRQQSQAQSRRSFRGAGNRSFRRYR